MDLNELKLANHKHEHLVKPNLVFNYVINDSFTILHVNIRSIQKNFVNLELLLASLDIQFSCIVLSETWLSQNSFYNDYKLDGYNFFNCSRAERTGGGVCVYIASKFWTREREVRLARSEAVMLEVFHGSSRLLVLLGVYRAPGGELPHFFDDLGASLRDLGNFAILVGDVNIDLNPLNNSYCYQYDDTLTGLGFLNLITSATRICPTKHSIIDHIAVNSLGLNINTCTINSDITDHLPCFASIELPNCTSKKTKPINKTHINFKAVNSELENYSWDLDNYFNTCDTNEDFKLFHESLVKIIKQNTNTIDKTKKNNLTMHKPWITKDLLKLIKQRRLLHDKLKQQPFNTIMKEKYRAYRNHVTNVLKFAKADYYKGLYDSCKDNQKEKWSFINKLVCNKNTHDQTIESLIYRGTSYSTDEDICNALNEHFVSVGINISKQLTESQTSHLDFLSACNLRMEQNSFNFTQVEHNEVLSILNTFSYKKATGPDNIPMRVLKENQDTLLPLLTKMTNNIIHSSIFPDNLKIARVKPVFKKGQTTDPNNYRPISILPALSKIIEKVLSKQIYNYFETHNLLSECQFGFRRNKNTTDATLDLVEYIYRNMESGIKTQGIFLDFSKAFDTVNHGLLIDKLLFYGFSSCACKLIKNYLTNRQQFVTLSDCRSTLQPVNIGVPQGSILGPLLFIIYINDLQYCTPSFNYILYADDTNLFSQDPKITKTEVLKIDNWCRANKLCLNYQKTNQVIFSNRTIEESNYSFEVNNKQVSILDETKFLGIILDSKLTFKNHVYHVCKKLNFVLLIMKSIRKYFDQKTMVNIYYTFFYPHLIYCLEIWGHSADTHLKRILTLQKQALRIILKLSPQDSVTTKFQMLNIMPIDKLFKFRLLLLLYRMIKTDENFLNNFEHTQHPYPTRNKPTYKQKTLSTNKGKRSIFHYGSTYLNMYGEILLSTGPQDIKRVLAALLWE